MESFAWSWWMYEKVQRNALNVFLWRIVGTETLFRVIFSWQPHYHSIKKIREVNHLLFRYLDFYLWLQSASVLLLAVLSLRKKSSSVILSLQSLSKTYSVSLLLCFDMHSLKWWLIVTLQMEVILHTNMANQSLKLVKNLLDSMLWIVNTNDFLWTWQAKYYNFINCQITSLVIQIGGN